MFFLRKNKPVLSELSSTAIPSHIGIIMDGNGRWAKKRGMPRSAGHSAGGKNFRVITRYCSQIGVKYLTVYAFSTENWKRPADEINALMDMFHSYLEEALSDYKDDDIVVKFIGDKSTFNPRLQDLMKRTEEGSKHRKGMVLNIAMNYGSRDEIVRAAKSLCRKTLSGKIKPDDITEQVFADYLYTKGQPDPDLIIRPSGEYRISNFMLWQCAYSEFIIMDRLWPDFSKEDLNKAILEYNKRNRRFGGVAGSE